MAIPLRDALRTTLEGWRNDLDPAWRTTLAQVELDFEAVDPDLQHGEADVIFPQRRGVHLPGAPGHAHVFRGLDGIRPERVRAVVIGQDPYPKIAQATGRAFEQGDLDDWPADARDVSESLERILAAVAAARTGDRSFTDPARTRTAWRRVIAARDEGRLSLLPPRELFDDWQRQGVLFLNAGLTISRFEANYQKRGHIPLWRPLVEAILAALVRRDEGQVVFLLWGGSARKVFADARLRDLAEAAGTWQTRVRTVEHAHPAAEEVDRTSARFFREPNPFEEANRQLEAMGAAPIAW